MDALKLISAASPHAATKSTAAATSDASPTDGALPANFKALLAQLKVHAPDAKTSANGLFSGKTDASSSKHITGDDKKADDSDPNAALAAAVTQGDTPLAGIALPALPPEPVRATGSDDKKTDDKNDKSDAVTATFAAAPGVIIPSAVPAAPSNVGTRINSAGDGNAASVAAEGSAKSTVPDAKIQSATAAGDASKIAGSGMPLPGVAGEGHQADTQNDVDTTALQQLAMAAQAQQPAAAAPTAAAGQIGAPVGSPTWSTEVGQHMILMVGQQQHVAELHLNPPHLGPLDIKLTVDGSSTTAVFTSPHSAVRDAINADLPRLREVLAGSGITLGNASVTSDTPRDGSAFAFQQPPQRSSQAISSTLGSLSDSSIGSVSSAPTIRRIGAVDLFA